MGELKQQVGAYFQAYGSMFMMGSHRIDPLLSGSSLAAGPVGYLPGLDGLRAVAVVAVVLFHADIEMFGGGWLGVNLFIVMSGWLITGGIIRELRAEPTLSYCTFIGRRVRRLVPGVALLLGGVGLLALAGQVVVSGDAVAAAMTWTSNWYQLLSLQGYWDQMNGAGPLDHLWSLAVEEQFYVAWPLLLIVVLRVLPHDRAERRILAVRFAAALGAVASIGAAVWGTWRGWSLDRLYLGTDIRSLGFLLGAACAAWLPAAGTRLRRALVAAGSVSAVLLTAAVVGFPSSRTMFRGSLQALDVLCLLVVVWAAGMCRGPLVVRPVVALGRWSYGVYLWHWPFMLIADDLVANSWLRAGAVLAAAVAVAAASYRFVEQPLRRRPWLQQPPVGLGPVRAVVAGCALAALTVPAIVGATSVTGAPPTIDFSDDALEAARSAGRPPSPAAPVPGNSTMTRLLPSSAGQIPTTAATTTRPVCTAIVHLGDSNLAIAHRLFQTSYDAAGVRVAIDAAFARAVASGADSPQQGTLSAIRSFRNVIGGQRCWVIALGSKDAADAFASEADPTPLVDAVVSALEGEPTIWVNTALQGPPPYSSEASARYNRALAAAVADEANITVVDWASVASRRADEFSIDGVHYLPSLYVSLVDTVTSAIWATWDVRVTPRDETSFLQRSGAG